MPLAHFAAPSPARSSLPLLGPSQNPRGSSKGPSSLELGSLHRRFAPVQRSSSSPSSLPSRWHARGSSCGTASVLLDPGCAGSSAAWPLTGAHCRLCLHASFVIFFKESAVVLIYSERRKGQYLGCRG
jgi:hypothetical protein